MIDSKGIALSGPCDSHGVYGHFLLLIGIKQVQITSRGPSMRRRMQQDAFKYVFEDIYPNCRVHLRRSLAKRTSLLKNPVNPHVKLSYASP